MVAVKRARVLMCLGVGRQKSTTTSSSGKRGALLKPAEKKVIVLAGPTGVGKTALSLELANRLRKKAEIISADSVQIYQGLDIGSRKLAVERREGIPHHLLDVLPPKAQYTAGDFYREAREKTREILSRGNTPIVVGGTGFWLRWYVQGRPTTPKSNAQTREEAKRRIEQVLRGPTEATNVDEEEALRWKRAVALLEDAGDPETAARLNRNDYFRLERALEIVLQTGKPLRNHLRRNNEGSELKEEDPMFKCFFLYPKSRLALYKRLDLSCEEMVLGGLLQETEALLDLGLKPGEGTATNAVGYKQFMKYLRKCRDERRKGGEDWMPSFDDIRWTVSEFQKHTRHLAQDQLTWFRTESAFKWVELNDAKGVKEAARRIHEDSFPGDLSLGSIPSDPLDQDFCFDNSAMGYLSKEEGKRLKGYPGVLDKLSGDNNAHEQQRLVQWVKATIEENASSRSTWA